MKIGLILFYFSLLCLTGCENERLIGAYTYGHEVETVTLCKGGKTYWIKATPYVRKKLHQAHKELTTMPYQSIYIEFSGEILEKKPTGFASVYSGYIQIDAVLDIRQRKPDRCKLPE